MHSPFSMIRSPGLFQINLRKFQLVNKIYKNKQSVTSANLYEISLKVRKEACILI